MSVRMNQSALKEEERKRNSGEKEDPIENEITLDDEDLTSGKFKIEEYTYEDMGFIIPPYAPVSGTAVDENGNIQIKEITTSSRCTALSSVASFATSRISSKVTLAPTRKRCFKSMSFSLIERRSRLTIANFLFSRFRKSIITSVNSLILI